MTQAAAPDATTQVQSITPVLTFNEGTEEAINLYVSLFPNSRVVSIVKSEGGLIPRGQVMSLDIATLRAAYDSGD